jgi:hypothetical protein
VWILRFLGEMEARRQRHLAIFPLLTLGITMGEFLSHCWKVLFSTAHLPGARQRSIGRACSARTFGFQVVPSGRSAPLFESSAIACWQQRRSRFGSAAGWRRYRALPDVGAREQSRVLGVLRIFNGIAGEPGSELGVMHRVLPDLFFETSVLDRALKETGARQKDGVAPLLPLTECRGGIGDGAFEIAAV